MKQFDETLKQMAQQENISAPDWAKACMDDALSNLSARSAQAKRKKNPLRYFGMSVAAVLAVMIALPNLSAQAAEAMQGLPVVGPLFELVTVRTYDYTDEYHDAHIEVPQIEVETENENPVLNETVDTINDDVQALTDRIIDQFEADCAAIGDEAHLGMDVRSDVVTNTDTWFTLRLQIWQGSGSSSTTYRFYHIDKTTGELATLSDLFNGDGYVAAISDEILRQMTEANEAGTGMYWVDSEIEDWNFRSIDPEQNFYFNENGDLVISFDEYEVAPGAAGCPEFVIPREVYADYLA